MADYTQNDVKVNYQSQAVEFDSGAILTAEQMDKIDAGILEAANAEKVATVLTELSGDISDINAKIGEVSGTTVMAEIGKKADASSIGTIPESSTVMEEINKKADATIIGAVPEGSTVMSKLAERGINLTFDEDTNLLHMVYEDGTKSEGIPVAQDLTGYATENYVEGRLDIGNVTVKKYVEDKVSAIDVSSKLGDYYNKAAIDSMDLTVIDGSEEVEFYLTKADGTQTEKQYFTKTNNPTYYRVFPTTATTFKTIVGNDKTPQKIYYKVGYMDNGSWSNNSYYERWVISNNGVITHTTTRIERFVDIASGKDAEFDFIPYLSNQGETTIMLEVYTTNNFETTTPVKSQTWYATKINFDLTADFPAPQLCGTSATIKCALPSGTAKKLTLSLDGEPYDSITLAENIISHEFVLHSNEHGAKLAQIDMEATIDGQLIPALPEVGNLIWYDQKNPEPILALTQTQYDVKRYDIVPIIYFPYAYFNDSDKNDLNLKVYSDESGEVELVADQTIGSGAFRTWNYPAETIRNGIVLKLVLSNEFASTSKEIIVNVENSSYNFEPVSGENFSFVAKKYSNNNIVNGQLPIGNDVIIHLNENFNLNSGGFTKDEDGIECFKIPAYNRARFIGKSLFNSGHDCHFKIVFKTKNARHNDVEFLNTGFLNGDTFIASDNGVKLTTNHGYVTASRTNVATSVFTTDEIIDYAFNVVNPSRHSGKIYTTENNGKIPVGYREGDYKDLTLEKYMIMPYEDCVASLPAVYTAEDLVDGLFENVGDIIEIGSDNCDVYVYAIRSYGQALGIDDMCKNFVADGQTLTDRRERYDRNNWNALTNNILKDPELASKLMPEVKIVLITAPYFTNDKKDEVEGTYIQVLQNSVYQETEQGRVMVDNKPYNWICSGGMHCGQGTSSNAYGFSGRNLTIKLGPNVYEGANTAFTGTEESEFESFVSKLDQVSSGKVAIRPDSIPVNQFNIKVNIASSENQNNALMARLYEKLLKQVYSRPAKLVDPRVKDTMDFDNCLVYIKETTQRPDFRREFLVDDNNTWHFYALGNFGDHKKTDNTRLDNKWNNTTAKWEADPLETVVEIMDYDVPLAGFNPEEDQCGLKPYNPNSPSYSEEGYEPIDYLTFGDLLTYTTTFDNGKGEGEETRLGIYEWDDEDGEYAFTGFGAINAAVLKDQTDKTKKYEEDLKYSYEFRYEMKKLTNSQRDENIKNWNTLYKKIAPIYKQLKNGTLSPRDAVSELKKYIVMDSAILFYLFTERFSLIDNRAKNTFWHYSKKYYSADEVTNLPSDIKTKFTDAKVIDDAEAAINNGYRWDLCFGYDFDTSLGIDNVGKLAFEYGQETQDRIFRTKVPIIQDGKEELTEGFNYFYEIFDLLGYEILSPIYNKNVTTQILFGSSGESGTILTWDNAQKQFPEKVWLRDIERKYIRTSENEFQVDGSITRLSGNKYNETVINSKEKDSQFLNDKANGLKRYHRRDFEKKQSMYMNSRWAHSQSITDYVNFRFKTSPEKVQIGFAQKCYYTITTELSTSNWDTPSPNWKIDEDGKYSYIIDLPIGGEALYIYPASEMSILRFPETYDSNVMEMAQAANIAQAKKLVEFSAGTTDGTEPIIGIQNDTFNNCPMLEKIDVTNCKNYQNNGDFNLSMVNNIGFREVFAENSGLVQITFAPNGMLETAKLGKIKKLSLVNLAQLETLTMDTNVLTSLRLENCFNEGSYNLINSTKDTLQELRLVGINWTDETKDINLRNANLFDELALLKGINERGETITKTDPDYHGAVLAGYVKAGESSTRIKSKYKGWWPELTFEVPPEKFLTEYKAEFFNLNKKTAKPDILISAVWGAEGEVIDIIDDPTVGPDIDKTYSFARWEILPQEEQPEGTPSAYLPDGTTKYTIYQDMKFGATYETAPREYTIHWKNYNGASAASDSKFVYGDGAIYSGPIPEKAKDGLVYSLFKGWDKYIYHLEPEEDTDSTPENPKYKDYIDVTAQFENGRASTSAGAQKVALNGMSITNINANCLQGRLSGEEGLEQKLFDFGDTVDVELGWDPTYDENLPEDRKPIFDLETSKYTVKYKSTTKNNVTITGPITFNYDDNSDSIRYINTGIPLFSYDEFTVVLDYQFNDDRLNKWTSGSGGTKNIEARLFDCTNSDSKYNSLMIMRSQYNDYGIRPDEDSTIGKVINPRLRIGTSDGGTLYKKNGSVSLLKDDDIAPLTDWYGSHYDRIVFRKKKDSKIIDVYCSRCHLSKQEKEIPNGDNLIDESQAGDLGNGVVHFTVELKDTRTYKHDGPVILGAGGYRRGSINSSYLCNCTIDTCKIWNIALTDAEVIKTANYPRETMTMKLTQFPRFSAQQGGLPWYAIDKSRGAVFPGIMLESKGFFRNRRKPEGTLPVYNNNGEPILDDAGAIQYKQPANRDGWVNTGVNRWLNSRIYDAMPQLWQSAIKKVDVKYIYDAAPNYEKSKWGDAQLGTTQSYLFVPAAVEHTNAYEGIPANGVYRNEGSPRIYNLNDEPIGLVASNEERQKFFRFGKHEFAGFNRTRSPVVDTTGYYRLLISGELATGTSINYKAWVDFAFCI